MKDLSDKVAKEWICKDSLIIGSICKNPNATDIISKCNWIIVEKVFNK